jgi:hypothetical protein
MRLTNTNEMKKTLKKFTLKKKTNKTTEREDIKKWQVSTF